MKSESFLFIYLFFKNIKIKPVFFAMSFMILLKANALFFSKLKKGQNSYKRKIRETATLFNNIIHGIEAKRKREK